MRQPPSGDRHVAPRVSLVSGPGDSIVTRTTVRPLSAHAARLARQRVGLLG